MAVTSRSATGVDGEHKRRLILVGGQEGTGKTTLIRSLLPETPLAAAVDAEDVGQVNPCPYDDAFFDLLRRNVAALVQNYWTAGFVNVITGSFFSNYSDYVAFRRLLVSRAEIFVVHLLVRKDVRNGRRLARAKQTSQEWRDAVDQVDIEDTTLKANADGEYRYIPIDSSLQDVTETIGVVKTAIPEIYSQRQQTGPPQP
jgi:ABC-type cobalamin/Fe3+-siderophores transport system ATPase subunit